MNLQSAARVIIGAVETECDKWLDAFFQSYYRFSPVNATFIGRHEFDAELPDFSENRLADRLAEIESLLDKAAQPE